MKVLVTGATGFIGKRLSERLAGSGNDVICAGRRLRVLGALLHKAKPVYLDINDLKAIRNILAMEKPDIVFHCAALVKNCSLPALMRVNKGGTYNVFEGCFLEGIKRVVYMSSISVISNNAASPITDDMPYAAANRYGLSKIEAEKIALSYRLKGVKVSVIRPVMVYGENEPHLLGTICKLVKKRMIPIIGGCQARLQLVYIDNVVDIMMFALKNEKAYEGTYIAADKEALSVREFFEYIAQCQDAKAPFVIPKKIAVLLENTPFIRKGVSFFTKDRLYSIRRIREHLGYIPQVSVFEGLKRAVKSYE